MRMRRILAPTDLSRAAEYGVDYAARMAKFFDARLLLVFVINPFPPDALAEGSLGPAISYGVLEQQRRAAKAAVERLRRRVERKHAVRCRGLVDEGPAARRIVEIARRAGCDLIVLATHGRGGLTRLMLGSVAEHVVRLAPCPVLTVRRAEKGAQRRAARQTRRPQRSRRAARRRRKS